MNRDRLLERRELDPPVVDAGKDGNVGEIRNVARDRVVESQLARLDQHERADADNRLGHGRDTEDRVRLHRLAGLDVAEAHAWQLCRLALPGDETHRSRDLAAVNAAGDVGAGALQSRPRQARVHGRRIHPGSVMPPATRGAFGPPGPPRPGCSGRQGRRFASLSGCALEPGRQRGDQLRLAKDAQRSLGDCRPPGADAPRYGVDGCAISFDVDVSLGRETRVFDANRGRRTLFKDEPMLLWAWSTDVENDDNGPVREPTGLDSIRQPEGDDVRVTVSQCGVLWHPA